MAAMPSEPSLPKPDRMMPIASSPLSSASEVRKVLIDMRREAGDAGEVRRRVPFLIVRIASGGIT